MNNAGGLGLNGVDENGEAKWDLITNIKPFRIEAATNTKALSDNWNIRMFYFVIEKSICL